jgi:hypothetical protein
MKSNFVVLELSRHKRMIKVCTDIVYKNPKHIKGIMAWRDKKRLLTISNKVLKDRVTLSYKDFQFLDSIVQKYG